VPIDTVRIVSDLHYCDRAGVRKLSSLAPLMEGIKELVLNGDSLEMRHEKSAPYTEEIRTFFAQAPIKITFVAGNHDPEISPVMELSFAQEAVWVTHGDVFWDSAAPWSRQAGQMRRLIAEERSRRRIDESSGTLDALLSAHRSANIRSGAPHDPTRRALPLRLMRLAGNLFPPAQPLRMLSAWQQGAAVARVWARRHRPAARFVVFGHLHFPGVWIASGDGPTIVNTGSFEPPLGGLCVDLSLSRFVVRQIEKRRGEFHPGRTLHDFPLAPGGD